MLDVAVIKKPAKIVRLESSITPRSFADLAGVSSL